MGFHYWGRRGGARGRRGGWGAVAGEQGAAAGSGGPSRGSKGPSWGSKGPKNHHFGLILGVARVFRVEKHGSARFSDRKTWIRAFFGSKNMDPRVFRVVKHGSARFSGRKTWIRAFKWAGEGVRLRGGRIHVFDPKKRADPCFTTRKTCGSMFFDPKNVRIHVFRPEK